MRRRMLALVLALAMAFPAGAQSGEAVTDSFVVDDVRVEGLRRFDPGVIFSRLKIDVGDSFAPDAAAPLLRELYQTGYFKSVEILRDGGVLVIRVSENPVIAEITFSGLEELNAERMLEILKEAGISRARVFDRSKLAEAANGIEEIYAARHFYNAEVNTVVSPLPRNRVGVLFEVDEGAEVAVTDVDIEGNEVFGDWTLRRLMEMKTRGLLNFFSDDYRYSEARLDADIERIRTLYLENGYLKFEVTEKETKLSEDKESIEVVIHVSEGIPYSVSEYVMGDGGEAAEKPFADFATQSEGDIYSSERASAAAAAFREHLQDLGYALARVDFDTDIDDATGDVRVVFTALPGNKVIVRRIEIVGNEQTADEVLRREFLQLEQETYSRAKVESSRRRLRRLGYFQDVRVEVQRIADAENEIDLIVTVDEGGLGDIRLGAGFGTDGGISFNGSFNAPNIFGSGDDFRIAGSYSDTKKSFSTGLDQPYHTDEGVSRHFALGYDENEAEEGSSDYKIDGYRATYGYGFPFVDDGKYFLRFAYKNTKLDNPNAIRNDVDHPYKPFIDKQGTDYQIGELQFDLSYDTRDSSTLPTLGNRIRFDTKTGIPGSDLRYYRADYRHDYYKKLNWFWTKPIFHFRGGFGFGDGYGGDIYPFFERYTLGGTASLRGFEAGSIGASCLPAENPAVTVTVSSEAYCLPNNAAVGGKSRLFGTAELPIEAKFFGTQKVFLSPFIDAGAVGGFNKATRLGAMRVSGGIELRWLSPIGPLRFSYVKALREQPGDKTEDFQFTVSTF